MPACPAWESSAWPSPARRKRLGERPSAAWLGSATAARARMPRGRGAVARDALVRRGRRGAARRLLAGAVARRYERNAILFLKGEPATRFFVVLEGWIRLFRETPEGQESTIGVFGPGESVAEAAMFDSGDYPVSCNVVARARLLTVPAGNFLEQIRQSPELALNLLGSMSRHLRRLVQQVEQLTSRSSLERLADFLLRLCPPGEPRAEVELPLDKGLVAARSRSDEGGSASSIRLHGQQFSGIAVHGSADHTRAVVDAQRAPSPGPFTGAMTMPKPESPATTRIRLTETIVRKATCPADKSEITLLDSEVPGLGLRIRRSGSKSWVFIYKDKARQTRRPKIGDSPAVSLDDARKAARVMAGQRAQGHDPAQARRDRTGHAGRRLGAVLTAYAASLERRQVVRRAEALSVLRRGLQAALGANRDLATITRLELVQLVERIEAAGKPGAARELRKHMLGMLTFAVEQGLIQANPLAGLRRRRRTRAQALAPVGRAFNDVEVAAFWRGTAQLDEPMQGFLRALLLTGLRLHEAALTRWSDIDREAGIWRVPEQRSKTGKPHVVPLTAELEAILDQLPRFVGCELLFAGRDSCR